MTDPRGEAHDEALDKLAEVHRAWCNYCRGNALLCLNAPAGGCSLRDYMIALQSASGHRATAKKHPDCEDRCQLKEHKGYDDCNHTGVCQHLKAEIDARYQRLSYRAPTAAGGKNYLALMAESNLPIELAVEIADLLDKALQPANARAVAICREQYERRIASDSITPMTDDYLTGYSEGCDHCAEAIATLPPEANELAAMMRDAARYRWLRAIENGEAAYEQFVHFADKELDAAIDLHLRSSRSPSE
jgi:hypothetical protein